MDLGISGKSAIVCASSKGLGYACAESLVKEGVSVTILARHQDALLEAQNKLMAIAEANVSIKSVVADIATVEGRQAVLSVCPNPDILVNNAGGPKPGNFRDWKREDWIAALDANMLAPIEMIKSTVDGMLERGFGRIINITSGAVKAPIDTLGLSNGARSGLTGFIAGISRKTISQGVTINNLLPGPFETDRLQITSQKIAEKQGISIEEVINKRRKANPSGRLGRPNEFGAMCAFLCSQQAAFMTGQNILLDGGAYPGTF